MNKAEFVTAISRFHNSELLGDERYAKASAAAKRCEPGNDESTHVDRLIDDDLEDVFGLLEVTIKKSSKTSRIRSIGAKTKQKSLRLAT